MARHRKTVSTRQRVADALARVVRTWEALRASPVVLGLALAAFMTLVPASHPTAAPQPTRAVQTSSMMTLARAPFIYYVGPQA